MSLGHIKIGDVGKWPAAIVRQHKGLIVGAMRTAVRVNAPGLIQAAIAGNPRPPVNTGDYKRSWKIDNLDEGVVIYNPTIQAGIIEHGRRPGFGVSRAGIDAITRWVHLHGMDTATLSVQTKRRVRRAILERRSRRLIGGIGDIVVRQQLSETLRSMKKWRQENKARSIAFAIALAIKRRGLPARPVLGPVTEILKRIVFSAINKAVQEAK